MALRRPSPALLTLALLSVVLLPCCPEGERASGAPSAEDTLARERAAAYFDEDQLASARRELAPLVERSDASADDLARAAAVEFGDGQYDAARALLGRALERDADHAGAHYVLARLATTDGDFESAEEHFRAALAAAPDDLPSRLGLAQVLWELGRNEEALELYESVVALGIEHGGGWYVTAIYRLFRAAVEGGDEEARARYEALWNEYQKRGFTAVSGRDQDRGRLGGVRPPRPQGSAAKPRQLPAFVAEPAVLPELAGARELFVHDLDGDRALDLLAAGPRGVAVALAEDQGYAPRTLLEEPVAFVRAFDLGNDDDLDLLVATGSGVRVLEAGEGGWDDGGRVVLPELPGAPSDAAAVDYDHDGDLDLLLVGSFGARLWRDDGAGTAEGRFADASDEAGMPATPAFAWCTFEDFDGDNDVDLLMGGPAGVYLADNRRGGRFADRTAEVLGSAAPMASEPLVADLDADARTDMFVPAEPASLLLQEPSGRLARRTSEASVPPSAPQVHGVDVDLDGSLDGLWRDGARIVGRLALGLPSEAPGVLADDVPAGPLAFADLERDLDVDVAVGTAQGVVVLRCEGPVGGAAWLEFLGTKDNRRGVGAIVEVRSGPIYRRIYWRGDPILAGVGSREWVDVLRLTWPNGVVQTELDLDLGDQTLIDADTFTQSEGLVGSCPFLYAWNGTDYGFVSDVLGVTPLGLPMAPGRLVPPDHDEFVLVRGDQLVPREGFLELQVTEELREVTYLDRVRVDVVDHPAGSEVWPDERFTFPPFPEPHVHTTRAPLAPRSALGSDGRDWTAALAAVDDVHAVPFEPLAPQFLGLATPHWLELSFDPRAVAGAPRLRLLMTGWFYWTDASVNVASARTPGIDFVPPLLQVPDGEGGWRDAGPPVGFPAGKTKTMVVDVGALLDRRDPRLRVASTLRLYWDAIRLAVDGDDAPLEVRSLEPASARLWRRGFSAPVAAEREDQPERFEWERLAEHPRWDPHPGRYTRYGEVVELLGAIDDRFVILGTGDALTLRFDARELPPPAAGRVRDYLVFLDGWAKDRDPNTVDALTVEPLPFHGMSGYPYGPDERFPDDELHRIWRAEWNTREAAPWIAPLAPRREVEWALGE